MISAYKIVPDEIDEIKVCMQGSAASALIISRTNWMFMHLWTDRRLWWTGAMKKNLI